MAEFQEYRKTATVEAVQVTEANCEALADAHEDIRLAAHRPETFGDDWEIVVKTREGPIQAPVVENPYLCRGVDNEMCLVDADIFEASYERMVEAFGPQEGDPPEMEDMMTVLIAIPREVFGDRQELMECLRDRLVDAWDQVVNKAVEIGWLPDPARTVRRTFPVKHGPE